MISSPAMRSSYSGNLALHFVTTVSRWEEALSITLSGSVPPWYCEFAYHLVIESTEPQYRELNTLENVALPHPQSHWDTDFSWPESERAAAGLWFSNSDKPELLIDFE